MATPGKYTTCVYFLIVLMRECGVSLAQRRTAETQVNAGLEIKCGEVKVRLTVKRLLFEGRGIPFKPENIRLGANSTQQESCGPKEPTSESEMVISVGLQECGTKSIVHGEWLVYSNLLMLFPVVVPIYTGSKIVKGSTSVIPVECYYKRKQIVNGEPLTPTWLPMTSTISVFGLLHFSFRIMTDDCTSPRSSSVYQQGEAVFLEANVEAPLHPPLTLYVDYCVATLKPDPLSLPSYKFITKHGCLIDSVLPGSSSKFLPREQDSRLCFSVQAFHFTQEYWEQMFISCHLRATLKQNSHSHLDKACFFHRQTFSWRSIEGDNALCKCCDANDCSGQTGEENIGHTGHQQDRTTQQETEKKHEADKTVGPLHTFPHSHWTGDLSITKESLPALLQGFQGSG
ncbi:zona pellucida sperm-binding protein 3-like [Scomber scombrus]|uniref:Zona pellucida sperm-binding protein 3 n=1 Tax=Scomber scombrus TaxID=13677 RepID=A0AAV1PY89_SCOSC